MNVLFVCTGNVCRSPMAEAFLLREAAEHGLDLAVRSTGTHAWDGRPATFDGRRIMTELGTPIDTHRAARTDAELVAWADLVICMAREHLRETVREFPEAAPKTYTLKGFLRILPDLGPLDDPAAWVRDADARRELHDTIEDADVDDPFGEREAAYRRVATEIDVLVRELAAGMAAKQVRRTA